MPLTKYTKDTAVIENVGTKPEDRTDLNDTTFKRKWDENATDWKEFWNDTASPEIDNSISTVSGDLSTHIGETITRVTTASRDLTISGTQKITLPFRAKSIRINAIVASTTQASFGFCDAALNQSVTHQYGASGLFTGNGSSTIRLSDGTNTAIGAVTLIENDGITITWTKSGSPTGTAAIYIEALTH